MAYQIATHGESRRNRKSVEYNAYHGAKARCENPNYRRFEHYGGRGIKFLFESFEQFLDEVGRKPSPDMSLDRIDVNGHYEPGNVRWATPKEQSANTRGWTPRRPPEGKPIAYNGERLSMSQWSKRLGISYDTIKQRRLADYCLDCVFKVVPTGSRWRCPHRKTIKSN